MVGADDATLRRRCSDAGDDPAVDAHASASSVATSVPELAGVPITGILGDQQSALFGQACIDPGVVKATYGTGAFILANVGPANPGVFDGLITTLAWDLGDGGPTYAVEGSAFVAGAAVQWLRDEMGFIDDSSQLEALALSVSDSAGVQFVPAFSGLGSPFWRSDARGSITGLSRGVGRGQVARALVEGARLSGARDDRRLSDGRASCCTNCAPTAARRRWTS